MYVHLSIPVTLGWSQLICDNITYVITLILNKNNVCVSVNYVTQFFL